MEKTWLRPYPPGTGRWLVIGWEAIALAFLGWTTVRNFGLNGQPVRVTVLALAVAWTVGAVRIATMGVYLGADGVQIRGLLRTRTLRWHDIAHVWLHRSTHQLGRWRIPGGMTVLIERGNGAMVNTELWAQGVDFHSRPQLFRAVYAELRDRHLAATHQRPAAA